MNGEEQYCHGRGLFTNNAFEQDGVRPTYGGYAERIVAGENYVLRSPLALDGGRAAPLFFAGITTYSPLRHLGVRAGDRCAVVGLGELGHMVKLFHALSAETTVLSHLASKEQEAPRLGSEGFFVSRESNDMRRHEGGFDFALDTVSPAHDYNAYLELPKRDGTLIFAGMPGPSPLDAASRRRRIIGSVIGRIRETQEMLEFALLTMFRRTSRASRCWTSTRPMSRCSVATFSFGSSST